MKTTRSNGLHYSMLAVLVCSFAFATSSSWAVLAETWNLNPGGANAPVGSSSQDFTASGYLLTARGYDNNGGIGAPRGLYFKNLGVSERGLGITGTYDFELQVTANGTPLQFIQLDIFMILSDGFVGGKLAVGSVQSEESWNLYGSNTKGSLGTLLNSTPFGSSTDEQFITIPQFGTWKFLSVVSAAGDVLPVTFQATLGVIPEAGSVIPVMMVIGAIAFEIRRRRRVTV